MGDEKKTLAERWNNFLPSKTLWFWSCVGVAIVTIVLGFTAGGWVTGGTAQEMADNAAEDARAQLVASVCVERFTQQNNFANHLADLKKADSWDREDIIEEGKWTQLAGVKETVDDAADVCAEKLAGLEAPQQKPTEKTASGTETGAS